MAMVNQMINLQPAPNPNVKDSRWLTLEVCREFQRSKCTRTENECKFAHPPPHVEVQNGRVIACFDSIKGKCQRKDPPCKYLHPPQHLREQLLQNGRNNLILRNLQLQAQAALQPFVPGMIPVAGNKLMAYPAGLPSGQYPIVVPPYVGSVPTTAIPSYNPYLNSMPTISVPGSESSALVAPQQVSGVIPTTVPALTQKIPRPDRLEESSYGQQPQVVEVLTAGKKRPRDPTDDLVLGALPAMVPPYKRMAVTDSKSGIPMAYQPSAINAYQHAALMQLGQQQQYIPVTWQLTSSPVSELYTIAGHPPSVPRF